jgi:putative transcriptional regulator
VSRNPTPEEIRTLRQAAGLSQTVAASLVHASLRAWQQWEAAPGTDGHRRMRASDWELFSIKVDRYMQDRARDEKVTAAAPGPASPPPGDSR